MDGLQRITLLPAQWLSQASSAFETKDASSGGGCDIVIFDPATIAAKAEYGDPYQPSVGISRAGGGTTRRDRW